MSYPFAARRSAILVVLSVLVACVSGPKIDATSSETCQSSLAAVGKTARASKDSAAVVTALLRLSTPMALHSLGAGFGSVFNALADKPRATVEPPDIDTLMIAGALCDGLNGATAHDLATKTDSLAPHVKTAFESRFARAYVTKLSAARDAARIVQDSVGTFTVDSARLQQEPGYIGMQTTIVMHVSNGTAHSIARAYFVGTAKSDGREIPWLEESFNHSIPGGLAPGEVALWRLQPNMFSGGWNKVQVPRDAKFVVRTVKLAGPDDEVLWGGAEFSVMDQKRLDSLSVVIERSAKK